MSRGLTGTMVTAAGAGVVYPVLFAYFDFSGGAVRVCTHNQSISWAAQTWSGLGDLGKVSPIKETKGIRANGLSFSLSGVPSSLIAEAIGLRSRGRACTLWLGLFNAAGSLLADPFQLWSGRMDQPIVEDTGETSTVTINAESRLIDLQRARERRYTDEDQQNFYAGDLGCEFVAGLQEKEIVWGKATTVAAAVQSGDSNDDFESKGYSGRSYGGFD